MESRREKLHTVGIFYDDCKLHCSLEKSNFNAFLLVNSYLCIVRPCLLYTSDAADE